MDELLKSSALLLVLLNPFLLIVYLTGIVQKLDQKQFSQVLFRAGMISSVVFCSFAILGDAIFVRFMQVEFASFQIFGGIVFLLIGLQFVFHGPAAIEILQGESKHLAGAIAMPVFIGPGTVSASVVIGKKHDPLMACLVIIATVIVCILTLMLLKKLHDVVLPRKEAIVQRYLEIAGRVTALIVGTIAIDMIMRGVRTWVEKF
ncbi:MAG: MarC family protein [Chromatiales bacterium]|jgi:small neutral amino acid transporter SnatA (MarC family)